MTESERDSMKSLTMKSRLEKASRVKVGPLLKMDLVAVERALCEFKEAVSGMLIAYDSLVGPRLLEGVRKYK